MIERTNINIPRKITTAIHSHYKNNDIKEDDNENDDEDEDDEDDEDDELYTLIIY